jgi:trehalose 6-phosphate synthase
LLINPSDAESVANALAHALAMPLEERRARHKDLYAAICEYDVHRWQREFLTALRGREERSGVQLYTSNRERTNQKMSERLAPTDKLPSLASVHSRSA